MDLPAARCEVKIDCTTQHRFQVTDHRQRRQRTMGGAGDGRNARAVWFTGVPQASTQSFRPNCGTSAPLVKHCREAPGSPRSDCKPVARYRL